MPKGIYIRTEEHKARISAARKAHCQTPKGQIQMAKATVAAHTFEANAKNSSANMGNQRALGYRHTPKHISTISGSNSHFWKGGISPNYGPDWPEQKRLALERDNHTCQLGVIFGWKLVNQETLGKEPDVHHIVPYKISQNNSLDNLIALCTRCHKWVEP